VIGAFLLDVLREHRNAQRERLEMLFGELEASLGLCFSQEVGKRLLYNKAAR